MAAPPRSPTTIDKAISQRFWEQRTAGSADPRSVTLDRQSAASVAREVQLYQRWMLRALAAAGVTPRRVLDLGCGNGDWTVMLAGRAERLVAVDFTEGFVTHCRERLRAIGLDDRATVVQHDVGTYEPEGPYDLIVAGAVTQYLSDDDIARLLPRLRAALAPGGALYLRTTVATHAERYATTTDSFQGIYRSRAWYRGALAAAGFSPMAESLATWFVADELARRAVGDRAAARALALPLQAIRWLYRFPRKHDVYVCVTRPEPAEAVASAPAVTPAAPP
jgi:protein-L-isoaspartate O-methyltransferase